GAGPRARCHCRLAKAAWCVRKRAQRGVAPLAQAATTMQGPTPVAVMLPVQEARQWLGARLQPLAPLRPVALLLLESAPAPAAALPQSAAFSDRSGRYRSPAWGAGPSARRISRLPAQRGHPGTGRATGW